ncbi:MAG: hypothetical protein ED859_16150 [Desulfuromonadales bacterium]|nr:MAG: hypothetical protein ED859_16150 [Desulfuromonadales bacterium]
MASVRLWQTLIAALVILFTGALVISMVMAGRAGSRVVDAHYYEHGLAYSRDSAGLRNGEDNGWRLETLKDGESLVIMVRGADGGPVTGGAMRIESAHGRRGETVRLLPLLEREPGVFAAPLPGNAQRVTVTFSKGEASLTGRVVVVR